MRTQLLLILASGLLAACVKPPVPDNGNPTVSIEATATNTYPGSSFRVSTTFSDDSTPLSQLSVTWTPSIDGIELVESTLEYAEFSIDLSVSPNQSFSVTANVEDASGGKTDASATLSVVPEPFIIIDAATPIVRTSESKPIFLTGVYSAKQINLKSSDSIDSTNYIIDISPNGQFVFYTQLLENSVWQAKLYDSSTDLNHTVDFNFTNTDKLNIASYWSTNSKYLAIKRPIMNTPASDELLWLSTENLTTLTTITPESEVIYFDSFTWGDNKSTEAAYASASTDTKMYVFDPESDTPLVQLSQTVPNTVAFTQVNTGTSQWATNQLFFLASTTVTADTNVTPYVTHLYNWRPSDSGTRQINVSASTVDVANFNAYVATQIAYTAKASAGADLSLWYYNGIEEAELTISGVTEFRTGYTDYDWSPDGRLLGIHNKANNVHNRFATWALDTTSLLHIDSPAVDLMPITDWNWDTDKNSFTVLSNRTNNTLVTATTDLANSFIKSVEGIFNDDTADSNTTAVEQSLVRSPTGLWHLYWAVDSQQSSDHIDLWAYNTSTGVTKNVTKLSQPYDAPISEGIFELQAGYANNTPMWVSQNIIWTGDDEIVFEVMEHGAAAVSPPVIADVRIISLDSDNEPRSLIMSPEQITTISRVIGE